MKKIFLCGIIFTAFAIFLSCNTKLSKANKKDDKVLTVTEPVFEIGVRCDSFCEYESDYTNIVAFTEYEQYKTDAERINCTVVNNNVGKGFYLYSFPFIERLEDDEWVQLDFWSSALTEENVWSLCCIRGNTTKSNSTQIVFLTEYLLEEFCPGEYRLVVFVGDKKVYAPFSVICE